VPRTQRSASLRCAAKPGPIVPAAQERGSRLCGASYRTMLRIAGRTLHRVRDTNFRYQCSRQTAKTQAFILAAHSARVVQYHVSQITEGAGKAGCSMHPQPRVQSKKAHERSYHRYAELVRPSLRNGFNAYSVLSPVNGSFATVACASYRRLDSSVAKSGPHDFAVRFGATRQRHLRVHRIPPHVRDDAYAPLTGGDAGEYTTDLGILKIRIFLQEGLDMPQSEHN